MSQRKILSSLEPNTQRSKHIIVLSKRNDDGSYTKFNDRNPQHANQTFVFITAAEFASAKYKAKQKKLKRIEQQQITAGFKNLLEKNNPIASPETNPNTNTHSEFPIHPQQPCETEYAGTVHEKDSNLSTKMETAQDDRIPDFIEVCQRIFIRVNQFFVCLCDQDDDLMNVLDIVRRSLGVCKVEYIHDKNIIYFPTDEHQALATLGLIKISSYEIATSKISALKEVSFQEFYAFLSDCFSTQSIEKRPDFLEIGVWTSRILFAKIGKYYIHFIDPINEPRTQATRLNSVFHNHFFEHYSEYPGIIFLKIKDYDQVRKLRPNFFQEYKCNSPEDQLLGLHTALNVAMNDTEYLKGLKNFCAQTDIEMAEPLGFTKPLKEFVSNDSFKFLQSQYKRKLETEEHSVKKIRRAH